MLLTQCTVFVFNGLNQACIFRQCCCLSSPRLTANKKPKRMYYVKRLRIACAPSSMKTFNGICKCVCRKTMLGPVGREDTRESDL